MAADNPRLPAATTALDDNTVRRSSALKGWKHTRIVVMPRRVAPVLFCGVVTSSLVALGPPARADGENPLASLVDAAAQRLQVAEPVAAYKWKTHGAIEDPVRVRQQLAELGDQAVAEHVDRATSPGFSVTRSALPRPSSTPGSRTGS